MKKRLVWIAVAALALCMLVGCMRVEVGVKVHSDGTADLKMIYAMSDSMIEMAGESPTLSDEEIAEYAAENITYEIYRDEAESYTGYVLKKTGVDLKESAGGADAGLNNALDASFIKVDGSHVTLRFTPFTEEEYDENSTYYSMLNQSGGYLRFVLETPSKPTAHNATEVSKDGKTLTWDMTALGRGEAIYAEFELKDSSHTILWIVICACVAAASAVAVILILRKRNAAVEPEGEPYATENPVPETPAEQTPAEEPAPVDPEDDCAQDEPEAEADGGEGDANGDEGDAGGDGE